MKITRRGLLGWLSALTGAAAVAKVAPAAAEPAPLGYLGTETVTYPLTGLRRALPTPQSIKALANPYALHPDYQALLDVSYSDLSMGYDDSWDARPIQELLDDCAASWKANLEANSGISSVMRGTAGGEPFVVRKQPDERWEDEYAKRVNANWEATLRRRNT